MGTNRWGPAGHRTFIRTKANGAAGSAVVAAGNLLKIEVDYRPDIAGHGKASAVDFYLSGALLATLTDSMFAPDTPLKDMWTNGLSPKSTDKGLTFFIKSGPDFGSPVVPWQVGSYVDTRAHDRLDFGIHAPTP